MRSQVSIQTWKKTYEDSLLMMSHEGLLEFMEREGEGCSYRQAYLDGGQKMG